jgi:hypothetical protein
VLRDSGLADVLKKGKPTKPARLVVVHSDFRGWQPLVGKRLPVETRYLDFTRERNDSLKPDPFPGPAEKLGGGTLVALAVARGAPFCELTLVRIDPAAPYQLGLLIRRLEKGLVYGESLTARREDLLATRGELDRRRRELSRERNAILDLFPDDRGQPKQDRTADPQQVARQERADKYRKAQAQFDDEEAAFLATERLYLQHLRDLRGLQATQVVVCALSWYTGYPADNGSALTRLLDDARRRGYLWIQAAGNAPGQAWTGLFRDRDGNGVMEFADASAPLPAGLWNHETCFLAHQPFQGARARALPAKTRLRVTMQWREAQDPDFRRDGAEPYREPLARLGLTVVRQPDPDGKTRPADDLQEVAKSAGAPQRIQSEDGSSVYEYAVEFSADTAARLGLRVEGVLPHSVQPPGAAELPQTIVKSELRIRLFVEVLEGEGRVVIDTYPGTAGGIGIPADAASALVVGATDATGKLQPYSTTGAVFNCELMRKPDVKTFDRLGLEGGKNAGGSGMSAGLAGGYAAALVGRGTACDDLLRVLRVGLRK